MAKWGFDLLFQGQNLSRLLEGLTLALYISAIAVVLSLVLGIILGIAQVKGHPLIRKIMRGYVHFIQIMPQLVLLFIAYFGLRAFAINLSPEMASIIVFTMWGTGEMSDLVRGAIVSMDHHQYESGLALGMSPRQVYIHVVIPQIAKRLIPLSMNLITRMIKTTSLLLMIGVVDIIKVSQQIIETNRLASPNGAFGIYLVVFMLYFISCYPISILARYLEKKWRI
ncbi:amino acid ABC transporter permease [Kandleria sp.]|uniref:amino acid ABC transporter permease n=1 Tax=Kandleria sp. TaxID=2774291 RepID=UPI001B6FF995|nr:amino acid ABC transporter permease [Kandleria sp.]MBP3276201.1 amino acid ABC transporter permease [Kandleria sp.]